MEGCLTQNFDTCKDICLEKCQFRETLDQPCVFYECVEESHFNWKQSTIVLSWTNGGIAIIFISWITYFCICRRRNIVAAVEVGQEAQENQEADGAGAGIGMANPHANFSLYSDESEDNDEI